MPHQFQNNARGLLSSSIADAATSLTPGGNSAAGGVSRWQALRERWAMVRAKLTAWWGLGAARWDAALGGHPFVSMGVAAAAVALPGIGSAKAKAIIAGRPWAEVSDLSRVSGISDANTRELARWLFI